MRVAIIPARGGSKRIPRKNIKPFVGVPIIYYPIQAAHDSGLFDEVYVSTDDPAIAICAENYGAVPLVRPAPLADDYTGTQDVVKHALEQLAGKDAEGGTIYEACCIYPTAALLQASDLEAALKDLLENKVCYVFSVCEYPAPIEWAMRIDDERRIQAAPVRSEVRSQDMGRAFHDAGYFYWGKAEAFAGGVPLYGPWSIGYELPRARCLDINTQEEWDLAELLYVAQIPYRAAA